MERTSTEILANHSSEEGVALSWVAKMRGYTSVHQRRGHEINVLTRIGRPWSAFLRSTSHGRGCGHWVVKGAVQYVNHLSKANGLLVFGKRLQFRKFWVSVVEHMGVALCFVTSEIERQAEERKNGQLPQRSRIFQEYA